MTQGHLAAIDPRFARTAAEMARAGVLIRAWQLKPAAVGAVDDRWAELAPGSDFEPRANATEPRAVLDSRSRGPVRVAELSAELGDVNATLKRLEEARAVAITRRRRMRTPEFRE